MTLFDLIVLGVLGLSALIGFVRGAMREVMTVFAFVVAVAVSLLVLGVTGPIAQTVVDPDWAANVAAVLAVFVVVYIAVRVIGGGLQDRLHRSGGLGSIDRAVGVGFGLVRGLVAIGVFHLVFHAATPPDRVPQWISDASLYPLAKSCAKALSELVPEGSLAAGKLGSRVEAAVRRGARDTEPGHAADAFTTETGRP